MKPTIAQLAAALIAVFEGLRLTAYQDPGGVWTVGIGHTGPEVVEGYEVSLDRAMLDFANDQAHLLTLVANRSVTDGAALVSFGFNCGIASLMLVLRGADSMDSPRYTRDRKGNVLPGLVTRRKLEILLRQL